MVSASSRGGDLFIVDHSISGWTGLRYLEEWCEIAERFDIASGYFEIGWLLELDGKWQKLDNIRILMGDEMTRRTKKALLEAVTAKVTASLDASLEADKGANPFLDGVPAVVKALRSGQIECRVYSKDKFHAKAYITHAKLEVVGARALVGSSNFTRLRGTWQGTLSSLWEDRESGMTPDPKTIFLAVRQTASTVSVRLFTDELRSRSSLAYVRAEDGQAQLDYFYVGEPDVSVEYRSKMHRESTSLDVIGSPPNRLKGRCSTNPTGPDGGPRWAHPRLLNGLTVPCPNRPSRATLPEHTPLRPMRSRAMQPTAQPGRCHSGQPHQHTDEKHRR